MAILKTAPDGADVLDLAAARTARAEAHAWEPYPLIRLAAGFVEVRREIDVTAADDFAAGKFKPGLMKLLVDATDVEELVKGGFTRDDLDAVTRFITGRHLGE